MRALLPLGTHSFSILFKVSSDRKAHFFAALVITSSLANTSTHVWIAIERLGFGIQIKVSRHPVSSLSARTTTLFILHNSFSPSAKKNPSLRHQHLF